MEGVMEAEIPDLWPSEIDKPNIITPVAIMKIQAARLRERTHGLIEAEITERHDGTRQHHDFTLVAKALGYSRYRVLVASHDAEQVYPVSVEAEALMNERGEGGEETAWTPEQFIEVLATVLRNQTVKSRILSIIAQSNEVVQSIRPPGPLPRVS
jgi:hypothetical protein